MIKIVFRVNKRKRSFIERNKKKDSHNSIGEVSASKMKQDSSKIDMSSSNAQIIFYELDENGNPIERGCPATVTQSGISYDPDKCIRRHLIGSKIEKEPDMNSDLENEEENLIIDE